MVEGVSKGFTRVLEINGVGYRAEVRGPDLHIALGYSHPVVYPLPKGVTASVERQIIITLTSADRRLLGETAAAIRGFRPPEPTRAKASSTAKRSSSAKRARRSAPRAHNRKVYVGQCKDSGAPPAPETGSEADPRQRRAPRICVYRSDKHIYAQVISDDKGVTLFSGLDAFARVKGKAKSSKGSAAAKPVGPGARPGVQGEKYQQRGFRPNGFLYHGGSRRWPMR
jgi:ribosomal protein L18